MIPLTTCESKNIALFGLGASGMVTIRALVEGGARVTAFDDNPVSVEKARAAGVIVADFRQENFEKFDELILAPGVPLTHPKPHWSVDLARSFQVDIIGDIELFCRERRMLAPNSTLIAITGTNGKSTTTALIAHILKHAGRKVEVGGNIGRPVLGFDGLSDRVTYVLEISSYQIDLSPGLDADIGILLNLSPDHLDRHGTMENYAALKERLVRQSKSVIIGVDDDFCRRIARKADIFPISVTCISVNEKLKNGVYTVDGELFYARSGEAEKVADLNSIGSLRGIHNAQNACIAWKACSESGLSNDEIQDGFATFYGLADRMEELGSVGNILIINDSKATNANATNMALGSFRRIYWIAGGLAKRGGIDSLAQYFPRIAKAYLIGESAAIFAATLGGTVEFEISGTLDRAVAHALEDAKRDGGTESVILLSPACASFDQFPNYAARGECFRVLVSRINGFTARKNHDQ